MAKCPHCGGELEGPLLERFFLCEKTCRTPFKMLEDGSLIWIPPQAVVCIGLSEVAEALSIYCVAGNLRDKYQKQAQQFRALSRVVS